MKKANSAISVLSALILASGFSLRAAEPSVPLANVKNGPLDVVLQDKYSKSSGLLKVSFGGKQLLRGDNNYLRIKNSEGKRVILQTKSDTASVYTTEKIAGGDVVCKFVKKFLEKAGAAPLAAMDTTMTIGVSSITVQCRATALADLNFDGYEANPLRMGFSMTAQNMKGWTVEAKIGEDLTMAPIEIPFVKEHFNLNKGYESIVFSGDGMSVSLSGENCAFRISRYSDTSCEIYAGFQKSTNGAPYSLKKGESFAFSFTIAFAKQQ